MAFNLSLPFISAEFFCHVTDFAHFHSSSVIMKDIWNLGIGIMLLYWKYIQTHSFSRYNFSGAKHLGFLLTHISNTKDFCDLVYQDTFLKSKLSAVKILSNDVARSFFPEKIKTSNQSDEIQSSEG